MKPVGSHFHNNFSQLQNANKLELQVYNVSPLFYMASISRLAMIFM